MTEPTQDKFFRLSRVPVDAALQSLQKKGSLRFRFRELKRSTELLGSGLQITRPHFEFTEHGIKQVIGTQFTEIANPPYSLEPGFWSTDVCDGDGAIESYDRRLIQFNEPIIKRKDLRPIGRFVVLCRAVTSGDPRLKVIFAEVVTCRGLREVKHSARNL